LTSGTSFKNTPRDSSDIAIAAISIKYSFEAVFYHLKESAGRQRESFEGQAGGEDERAGLTKRFYPPKL